MAFWEYVKPSTESLISWNFARSKSEENVTNLRMRLGQIASVLERMAPQG